MSSPNYTKLKIVNWNLVQEISVKDLRLNKDPKTIKKLIVNFLNSASLFADPSYCSSDLVLKYFQLIQISVSVMANHIKSLNKKIEDQNNEINQLKAANDRKNSKVPRYILPPVVFQCVFCSKLFKTRLFLNNHIKRRHPERKYPITQDQPPNNEPKVEHVVKTVTSVPEISQDLGPFQAEVNAMLNHFDTVLKNEQTSVRADYMEHFHRLEFMIQETLKKVQEERNNTMRRAKGSTDASYSDAEAMKDRLQATDNSSDTHIYSQHGESDNDDNNEQFFSNSSEEDYYSSYSINDGLAQHDSHNMRTSEASSSATRLTPTPAIDDAPAGHTRPTSIPHSPTRTSTYSTATASLNAATTPTTNYDSQNYEYYEYAE